MTDSVMLAFEFVPTGKVNLSEPIPYWSPMVKYYTETKFKNLRLVYLVRIKPKGLFRRFVELMTRIYFP